MGEEARFYTATAQTRFFAETLKKSAALVGKLGISASRARPVSPLATCQTL